MSKVSWSGGFGALDSEEAEQKGDGAKMVIRGLFVAIFKTLLLGGTFYLGFLALDALLPFTASHGLKSFLWCLPLAISVILARATVQAGISDD